jgi:nicotinamide mononucleotide adenylyltransferase
LLKIQNRDIIIVKDIDMAEKISAITVHGRFQPPLHINHWEYVKQGFERANHVTLLITNPFNDESFDAAASWRNDPENNPFTFEERVFMFSRFFAAMGIAGDRYDIRPFNIKDDTAFAELDPSVPNLVNVYSEWSAKKVEAFQEHGLQVIRLDQAKTKPVSGTKIRGIIKASDGDRIVLERQLVEAGFMQEAVSGLLEILDKKDQA